ncbi:hypothetical protein [Limnofasciculus baicalensis]|uniref:Uncharacterized protein n=1 Tax=Limnofasciculus baicalensis BBK-W-15 TaxID=2699891 RepID=A0AAE3KV17_9CYAN|nr:hypothetical protein [Limnofasciculus baicalensis]MCP2732092.1 hypothetical protein [Limnofasciculus baicalensis BBK-W-15]
MKTRDKTKNLPVADASAGLLSIYVAWLRILIKKPRCLRLPLRSQSAHFTLN